MVGNGGDNIDGDHADWGDAKFLCGATNPNPQPPQPVIVTPVPGTLWTVNQVIAFSGTATDAEDGTLPASALSWSLVMQHCPSNCHSHVIQDYAGVASGSFAAPDHEYPSYLELRLTATDTSGRATTVTRGLDPVTVPVTIASVPPGLQLVVDGTERGDAVHADRHRRFGAHRLRRHPADAGRHELRVRQLVRRRFAEPRVRRGPDDVGAHRDLP